METDRLSRASTAENFTKLSSVDRSGSEDTVSDIYQMIDEEPERFDGKSRSGVPMTAFNFINSILGSGILGMPYALKEAGFGLGVCLIMVVAAITDYSVNLLIQAGQLSNTRSYQEMVRSAFGRPGYLLLTSLQFIYPFISMISYNVIVGDTVTKVVGRIGGVGIEGTVLQNRQFIIFAVSLLITLPLCLYQDIAKLAKASVLSFVLIIFINIVMIVRGFQIAPQVPATLHAWEFVNPGVMQGIAVMSFAFMCHHNTFLLYDSLEDKSEKRWSVVTHLSVLVSMMCTLIFGIVGYATFTGHTQGDVMENYCFADDIMNVTRMAFALTVLLTFPIECFVVRQVIDISLYPGQQPTPLGRHCVMTVGIVATNAVLSMLTDCLSIVLELNGVIAASPLAFILPPLCVLRLQQERILTLKNFIPISLVVFGAVVSCVGLVQVFLKLVTGVALCSHGIEPAYCLIQNGTANTTTEGVSTVGAGPSVTTVLPILTDLLLQTDNQTFY